MAATGLPLVIALEEHYYDAELAATFEGPEGRAGETRRRLLDLGELRIAEMDAAGIDVQVISHGAPSVQRLDAETAVWMARGANDRLAESIAQHPDRFAGFAALPTPDPEAAAAELDRAVTQLGFKGAMIHGLTNGAFLDERRFWPIFERAQALDVPLYLHPAVPHRSVAETYYQEYLQEFPSILTAGWGFGVETATQAIRLVLSGAFETYPGLKIVLGHMGEGLPFLLWRLDHAFSRPGNARGGRPISFRDEFSQHVWITTSGNFSTPALLCSMMELGVDRIMFSVDYPFVQNPPGTAWLQSLQLSAEDKAKIAGGNAKRLLKL
ncbi:MAG: amidohydrolase family protein [Chloroflexota bacterium]